MMRKPVVVVPVEKSAGLAEQIVGQLVGLVKSGDLKPGDRLPAERTLARDLGVGRPTLREALKALELLGILDIRHGGGVFVSDMLPDTLLGPLHLFLRLDHPNLDTILEARKVIEGALLAYVAEIVDEHTIAKLKGNLAKLEQLVDDSGSGDVDRARFHGLAQEFRDILEEGIDNPILSRAVKSLDMLSAAIRSHVTTVGSVTELLANHRRIVEALIRHDPSAARQALDAHIAYLCNACKVTLRQPRHA